MRSIEVRTIEVTHAVRATAVNGLTIAEGDVIGLLNDKIVASGQSAQTVVESVLATVPADAVRTVTVYAGLEAPEGEREAVRAAIATRFPKASVELQAGDQALYPYIVAVE